MEEQKDSSLSREEKMLAAGEEKLGLPAPDDSRPVRFGRLLIGLCLLFAGVALLLRSLGYLPAGFELDVFRFWPIPLVALGLSLLDRRSKLAFVVGLAVTVLLLVMFALVLEGSLTRDSDFSDAPQFPDRAERYSDAPMHYGAGQLEMQ